MYVVEEIRRNDCEHSQRPLIINNIKFVWVFVYIFNFIYLICLHILCLDKVNLSVGCEAVANRFSIWTGPNLFATAWHSTQEYFRQIYYYLLLGTFVGQTYGFKNRG